VDEVAQRTQEIDDVSIARVGNALLEGEAHQQNPRARSVDCLRFNMVLITSLATKAAMPSLMRARKELEVPLCAGCLEHSRISSPNSLDSMALLSDVNLWDSETNSGWHSNSGENGEAPQSGGDAGLLPPRGGGAGPRRHMRGTGKPAPQEAQTRRLTVGRIARQLWFLSKVKGSPAELSSEMMTTSIDCGFRVGEARALVESPPPRSMPVPRPSDQE
jgi:hypothetical protein